MPPAEKVPATHATQAAACVVPPVEFVPVPAAQLVHDVEPCEVEYVPAAHEWHESPLNAEYWPAKHAAHAEAAVAPAVAVEAPAAQLMHAELPPEAEYDPMAQVVQLAAPANEKEPAAQVRHDDNAPAPGELDAVPAGHCKQEEAPAVE